MGSSDLGVGSFVTNPNAPDWGVGKVIAIKEKERRQILFEYAGLKVVIKDFLSPAVTPENHPVLKSVDNINELAGFRPFTDLEAFFLKKFEKGFEDPEYLEHERLYKENASKLMKRCCSKKILEELLHNGSYAEVCNLAKRIMNRTNLIFRNEKMSLSDGLKDAEDQKLFSTQLYSLLYGSGDEGERFESFVTALEELDACKWTTATYFLYLSEPNRYPFVKPSNINDAAKSYAFDISYTIYPNWVTYTRIIDFVNYVASLLERRATLKPRDLIDVQSFIWCALQSG